MYRRLADGRHFYRIEGPRAFTEIQVIGRRAVLYRVEAAAYPEQVRVAEMVACEGPFQAMDPEEWERMFAGIG